MKRIILERNIEYSVWQDLIYYLIFFAGLFIGSTFFESGPIARFFSIFSGLVLIICLFFILLKKGLIIDIDLYKGYFIFGILLKKNKIECSGIQEFTLIVKKYKQKYQRGRREPNMEYYLKKFEFYFIDMYGKTKIEFINCRTENTSERLKEFIIENTKLNFINP